MKRNVTNDYSQVTERYLYLSLRITFLVISTLLIHSHSFSQNVYEPNIDSIITEHTNTDTSNSLIQKNHFILFPDSAENDTATNNSRLHSLKTRLLHELSPDKTLVESKVISREEQFYNGFNSYQGRVIRNISFKKLEIFGQNVTDTTEVPTKWLERLGNELHINTQLHVFRNRLLFQIGDTVDLYTLSENERLFRELPFIDDARIIISEVSEDSVDIIFITKDVLPIGGSIELLDVDYGKASISNKNVLGLGHEVYYHLTWNYDRIPFYGHKIRYKIQNIGNTFFSLETSYENQWNIEAFKFYCNRDFFTQDVRYAGGVSFEKINSIKNIISPDTIMQDIEVDYNHYDLWLGRAISIPRISSRNKRTNIAGTGRITRYEFFNRPEVEEGLLYDYHERTSYLFSVGISQVGYFKTSHVYGFGRTEDIPFGNSLAFTTGVEYNEYFNRPYFGVRYAWGKGIRKIGYLYHRIDYGTFLNYGIEQGLLVYKLKYFTNLLNNSGRYFYRIFADMTYKSGYNRFEDEFMEFTKSDGIRGLSSEELRGNQRMNLSLESVCYSPHELLGFRFVYFLFFDAGIISNRNLVLIQNHLYSGFGGGIRIRNENLAFDTVILRFGYYPILPENASPEYIELTSIRNPRLDNFIIQRPEIIKY